MSTIYLGTIDGGGDGKALLLAGINALQGTNYTLDDWDFGIPELVTVPQPTHNSKVAFGPKEGTGAYGVKTIYYNRIHASELGGVIVPYAGEMYITDVLTKINEKYGILIKPTDIYDSVIPAPGVGQNQVQVTLQFRPESIIFYDGVQIQIGTNDPTGDTEPTAPFEAYHSFMFNQVQDFEIGGTPYVTLEPFSLAVDRDRVRQRVGLMRDDTFTNNATAHIRDRMTKSEFEARKSYLPFVGMWRDDVGKKHYAVNVVGDVYMSTLNVDGWEFVANALGYDSTDPAVVTAAYAAPYVKAVTQDATGITWFLARGTDGVPRVYNTSTSQTSWTPIATQTLRMISLKATAWAGLEVLDALHIDNKLHLLIRAAEQYDVHPNKSQSTPSIEIISTNGGGVDYFPLGETLAQYSGIELNTASAEGRWTFVSPRAGATVVDVAALLPTALNNNTYAVFYRHVAGEEYVASILPHSFLGNAGVRPEMSLRAYQLPLDDIKAEIAGVPVTNHYLDVVEIVAPTEVSGFNHYFLKTGERTQLNFLSYGVKVLTSVATRTARAPWYESQVTLTSSQQPVQVVIECKGLRNHLLFQNAEAVHRLLFRQNTGDTTFKAELDSSIQLEGHTGFAHVCTRGAGVYVPPAVIDSPLLTTALTVDQDFESVFADINYSFMAKDAGGVYRWYTATAENGPLALRVPSRNYAFMGSAPCLVAAENDTLLYWAPGGNGIFQSANKGKSWQEFAAAPSFYRQEQAPSPNLNVVGSAILKLRPEHFLESTLIDGVLVVETKINEPVEIYDVNAEQTSRSTTLQDHMLYRVESGDQVYTSSGVQSGFGLNALGAFSPRRILAWDSDADNNFETIGLYTTNAAAPYAAKYNQDNYLFNVVGTLRDFSRDAKYLGYRHWILVDDQNVWNLHFTNVVEPEKTIGMFGSTNVALATFKPEVSFHLWDYLDVGQQYIPYVFYGNKRIVLLERLDNTSDFEATHHILNIPGDNGQALLPVPMHTANRRDYVLVQKGNGIFRVAYTWDGINEVSSVALTKIFDLSGALATLDILSGTRTGIAPQNAPMETMIPDQLPNGTLIGWYCIDTAKHIRYADGAGGYTETIETDSADCGFTSSMVVGGGTGFSGGEG